MLEKLDNGNRRLAVLTNKPVRISVGILDGLGIGTAFFSRIWWEQLRAEEAASHWCGNACYVNRALERNEL